MMKMLERKLHTDAPTIYGNTWKDILDTVTAKENKVIHTLENPVAKEPGLKVLRGNISPAGAIVRPTAVFEEVKYLKGASRKYLRATSRLMKQSCQVRLCLEILL